MTQDVIGSKACPVCNDVVDILDVVEFVEKMISGIPEAQKIELHTRMLSPHKVWTAGDGVIECAGSRLEV